MTNRRVFLGVAAAAGVAAATGMAPLARGQGRGRGSPGARETAQLREFKRQAKVALALMYKGDAVGATLMANALLAQAAVFEDGGLDQQIQAAAKRVGRYPARPRDHAEIDQLSADLGVADLGLSLHVAPDPKYVGQPYDALMRGASVAAKLREAAVLLEREAAKWPKNGLGLARVRQSSCPVCDYAASYMAWASYLCDLVAACIVYPPSCEPAAVACGSAMAAAIALQMSCQLAAVFGC